MVTDGRVIRILSHSLDLIIKSVPSTRPSQQTIKCSGRFGKNYNSIVRRRPEEAEKSSSSSFLFVPLAIGSQFSGIAAECYPLGFNQQKLCKETIQRGGIRTISWRQRKKGQRSDKSKITLLLSY